MPYFDIPISIHAPVKGATSLDRHHQGHADFNPRSREGSDTSQLAEGMYTMEFQSTLP